MTVVSGEAVEEPVSVRPTAQREGGELNAGNPAFGADEQRVELAVSQRPPRHPMHELRRIHSAKGQVLLPELSDLVAQSKPVLQKGRRDRTPGDHEVQRR